MSFRALPENLNNVKDASLTLSMTCSQGHSERSEASMTYARV